MATTDPRLALASLEAIGEAGIGFALLHGYERLVRGDVSDIDIVVGEEPTVVIRRAAALWEPRGLRAVVLWPYDIGGTATVFLTTPEASEGVQLDLLYDPDGIGEHRVKSTALLAGAAASPGGLPMVSETASLIYQWQKRAVKHDLARLQELTRVASTIDRSALLSTSEAITGSPAAARRMIDGTPLLKRQRTNRPAQRGIRLVRRLVTPVGFWAHTADAGTGTELARRFSRFLVCARTQPTPSSTRTWAWWATGIMPIRLRPGVFVSTGRLPHWPAPDFILTQPALDGAARQLTAAMAARIDSGGEGREP